MDSHAKTRGILSDRWSVLRRRIDRVEGIAGSCGFGCGGDSADLTANPILQRFLEGSCAEVAKAEAAIRRLDGREFDCCIMCGGKIDSCELERHPYTVNCRNCAGQFPADYADHVRIQHSDLYRMWMSLLEVVSDLSTLESGRQTLEAELCACHAIIDCLTVELDEHFEREEEGGYLHAALAVAPQFDRQAKLLMRQHRDFSERLGRIRIALPRRSSDPSSWSQLQLDLQDLAGQLKEHEDLENEILGAAFLDDLGGEG